MIRVIGYSDAKDEFTINSTSHSTDFGKGLSPFFLGPVKMYNGCVSEYSKNVENAWQFSKVYKQFTKNEEPTENYFNWAKKGWESNWANRYPMGKGSKPLYALWENEKLGYIEARKKIYIPLYVEAVRKTKAFEQLEDFYNKHGEITILDFDGYDHRRLGMTLEDVVNDSKRTMGHGFVLAMLLENML